MRHVHIHRDDVISHFYFSTQRELEAEISRLQEASKQSEDIIQKLQVSSLSNVDSLRPACGEDDNVCVLLTG